MKTPNPFKTIGYDLCEGASNYFFKLVAFAIVIVVIISFICALFGIGIDETDRDGFHRSGLKLLTDYGTGIQYLSDGHGGLIERKQPAPKP